MLLQKKFEIENDLPQIGLRERKLLWLFFYLLCFIGAYRSNGPKQFDIKSKLSKKTCGPFLKSNTLKDLLQYKATE